ncbi:hypothetical protein TSMG0021 [Halocynthia phage JM-2012]|uniref:hypothetical protein n=1 Tax=Halocynthia phage JM-2012 TaxID=1173297 RepID=UPI00025C68E4|nr:hypothetical protein TSMG0021 [Halocynthia phage JM-2012]AFI55304.1 hypothetical protein TSMG0021 [Halocynthia phage JM-2012]
MHVDDLMFVIELERANMVKLVEIETGISIENQSGDLLSSLQSRYEESLTKGVCYNDISWLKNFTAFEPITKHLSASDYPTEPSLVGVVNYRQVLKGCISVIKNKG